MQTSRGCSSRGVQLSPLGFAVCQSKNCTNNANRANYRRVWHPAIPTQTPNYLPTEATETTEVSDARYYPTDCTDGHRLGGYGIPAIPTLPPNYLPTEPTETTEVSDARYSPTEHTETTGARYSPTDCGYTQIRRVWHPAIPTQQPNYLPTEPTEPTEVSDARYSPTDCTDGHRLEGYGILPYPRRHQTIFPQKPTQPNHLWASVNSVGGSSPPKASVCSVNSVGGSSLPEASVNSVGEPYAAKQSVGICEICGRLFYARSFCEFRGFCGMIAMLVHECSVGAAETAAPPGRAAWVWQGCHTLLR